ncbi:hypothetical protein [Hoylesella enoeca]|uniref:hypothetical protein n=1 Tax=Hoylesella enoeca TaxID=76123 RepID=UPI000A8F98A3
MDSELENKQQDSSTEQNQNNRESIQPEGYYQREHRSGVRPQRPRIHTSRAYNTGRNNDGDGGGFRPEGFGSGLQSGGDEMQPRQYRPRFNNNGGGYQPRQGGYGQPRQGGYRPRYNNDDDNGGGYQPRKVAMDNLVRAVIVLIIVIMVWTAAINHVKAAINRVRAISLVRVVINLVLRVVISPEELITTIVVAIIAAVTTIIAVVITIVAAIIKVAVIVNGRPIMTRMLNTA